MITTYNISTWNFASSGGPRWKWNIHHLPTFGEGYTLDTNAHQWLSLTSPELDFLNCTSVLLSFDSIYDIEEEFQWRGIWIYGNSDILFYRNQPSIDLNQQIDISYSAARQSNYIFQLYFKLPKYHHFLTTKWDISKEFTITTSEIGGGIGSWGIGYDFIIS